MLKIHIHSIADFFTKNLATEGWIYPNMPLTVKMYLKFLLCPFLYFVDPQLIKILEKTKEHLLRYLKMESN